MVPFKMFSSYILDITGGRERGTKVIVMCITNKLFPIQTRESTRNVIILLHHSLRNNYL